MKTSGLSCFACFWQNSMIHLQQLGHRNLKSLQLFVCLVGLILLGTLIIPSHIEEDHVSYKSESKMKVQVHLDLKGAPPKIDHYSELFKLFEDLKINSVLIEYEDMFPYSGELSILKASNAYSQEDIKKINDLANKHNINLIPLVQTFGHLEFVLKHRQFSHLSENPTLFDTICPSDASSLVLINEMISQIRNLHSTNDIHLGADEAYHIAEDERCKIALKTKFNESVDSLKLQHISNVAHIARKHNFTRIYVWNDMFEKMKSDQLLTFALDKLVVPVVWGYIVDVTKEGYFPKGMFHEYSKVFPEMTFGSAFKGANGIQTTFMESRRYLQNLQSYHDLEQMFSKDLEGKIHEIVLTGWQRYKHGEALCELLPVGIPTLVEQVFYIRNWDQKVPVVDRDAVQKFLHCNKTEISDIVFNDSVFHIPPEWQYLNCEFPGVGVYRAVEELRLARWKNSVDPDHNKTLQLEPKLRLELGKIYHNDTVNEWINQNLYTKSTKH